MSVGVRGVQKWRRRRARAALAAFEPVPSTSLPCLSSKKKKHQKNNGTKQLTVSWFGSVRFRFQKNLNGSVVSYGWGIAHWICSLEEEYCFWIVFLLCIRGVLKKRDIDFGECFFCTLEML